MILALAGIYGTLAFGVNVLTTIFLVDRWGRRRYVPTHPIQPLRVRNGTVDA